MAIDKIVLTEYPIPDAYKEQIFGASDSTNFWNPQADEPSIITKRPFCNWEEYHEMMITAWKEDDYTTLRIVTELAIIDDQMYSEEGL